MKQAIANFLAALDAALLPYAKPDEHLDLYHLGRSALLFHLNYMGSTKDFDFLWLRKSPLEDLALSLFGKTTANAAAFGLYLEAIPQGLPPVPGGLEKRSQPISGPWKVLRIWRPEWNDLAATKLKRFHLGDREDIRYLCDEGLLDAELLLKSLESAFLMTHEKDGDPNRERAFANYLRVKHYLDGVIKEF